MAKGVFITRIDSSYDDLPEQRYHFPAQYLSRVQQCIGDWIIYYEPSRVGGSSNLRTGRMVYFAVARVSQVDGDAAQPGHYYARVQDYLEFDRVVPLSVGGPGAFRNAVRILSDDEFRTILSAGFSGVVEPFNADISTVTATGLEDSQLDFTRPIIEQIVRRPFRDAAFSRHVGTAYHYRCAITGFGIRNGGGRPEIEAAHIQPVADGHNGPDSVRNGIALSRTAHWLFDRGLITLANDYRIITSKKLPADAKRLLNESGYALVPTAEAQRPHQRFVTYHQSYIFKE